MECPICLEEIEQMYKTKCNHNFCVGCIMEHLKKNQTCPMCREYIGSKDMKKVISEMIDDLFRRILIEEGLPP